MSDHEDERPLKRARRDSGVRDRSSRHEPRETTNTDQRRYNQDHDENRRSDHKHRRQDRRTDGEDDRSRPISPASDSDRRQKSERRHRDRHGHEHSRRHYSRSHSRERSTSPRQDSHSHSRRHKHSSKETRNDNNRDKDRDRSKGGRSRHHKSPSPAPYNRSKAPLPSQLDAFTSTSTTTPTLQSDPLASKQKPNFNPTGKLAAASNTIQTANQTIVLKYHEPAEARKPAPRDNWRLYVFKGDDILDTVELGAQSCWLFGREVAVADIPVEHPSCSKQHAVVQFRYVEKRSEFGDRVGRVRPYVIDLESANGTSVNGEAVPSAKYVELRDKDVVRFGESTREYVIQLPPKV